MIKKYQALILAFLIFFNCIIQNGCNKKNFPNGSLKIFFCGQYLSDANSDAIDVLKEFEKKYKIKITAYSTFESNEQLYAKLKYGKIDYDVILPSDYMILRLLKEKMLQKIDIYKLKNYSEINPAFKGSRCGYDPTDEFSVPYTWCRIGIIYNKPMIEKLTGQKAEEVVHGFDCLFNKKLKNEILMFPNSKDSFEIAQKTLNRSINSTDLNEIREAAALLKKQKPLVQGYGVDENTDKMINNEAAIAPAYSGDAITMMKENENLRFFCPKNSIMSVDAMCIPINAKNVDNAHKFIDFMCSAKIAAENCNFSSFSTTINSAFDLLDDETKNNTIAYPPEEEIKNCETQQFLTEQAEQEIANLWEQVKL